MKIPPIPPPPPYPHPYLSSLLSRTSSLPFQRRRLVLPMHVLCLHHSSRTTVYTSPSSCICYLPPLSPLHPSPPSPSLSFLCLAARQLRSHQQAGLWGGCGFPHQTTESTGGVSACVFVQCVCSVCACACACVCACVGALPLRSS